MGMNFLIDSGKVTWVGETEAVTMESFRSNFEDYLRNIGNATDKDGVVGSWYQIYKDLTGGALWPGDVDKHCIFLNSFGVDTRKVVTATVKDETQVIQVAVNFELWEQRDVEKFKAQFTNPARSSSKDKDQSKQPEQQK